MKKIAFTAFLGILLMSSCTKEYYEVVEEVAPNFFYKSIVINWDQWKKSSDDTGNYYYYVANEPRLTSDVLNSAMMETFYVYILEGTNNVSYVPLSYSDFWADKEEYFTVQYSVGSIRILYKATDSTDEPPYYDTYDFEARFMW